MSTHRTGQVRRRRRIVGVRQWARIANRAVGAVDDGQSVAAARGLIATGEGPPVTRVGRRDGVRIEDHERWLQATPWAHDLATLPQVEREEQTARRRAVADAKYITKLYTQYCASRWCYQMPFKRWLNRRQRLKDRHSPRPRRANKGGVK